MSYTSFVSKKTITFSISVIAALSLFLVVGPIVTNQKVLAANLCGSGLGCGGASNHGCDGCDGISYPSPLSNFFGGEAFHFHHFHGGFGFHHFEPSCNNSSGPVHVQAILSQKMVMMCT
jgi:hypothetical protein